MRILVRFGGESPIEVVEVVSDEAPGRGCATMLSDNEKDK